MSGQEEKNMQKPRRTPLYTVVRAIYAVLAKCVFRMRFYGRENIPQAGNYIIMANHICLLDPLTLALCDFRREIHFMGKKELFRNKLLAWLWRQVHAFPVDRGNVDMAAIRTAMKVLQGGDTLGIFPEGTRSRTGQMGPLLSGTSLLALRSGVPVLPVYIAGRYRPLSRMQVIIGQPMTAEDLRQSGINKEACEVFTQRLEASFVGLQTQIKKIS